LNIKGDFLPWLFLGNYFFSPLRPELNPICYLLALLAHDILHVRRIRVKSLTPYLLTPWSRVLPEKLTSDFAASQEIPR
jgi:transposase